MPQTPYPSGLLAMSAGLPPEHGAGSGPRVDVPFGNGVAIGGNSGGERYVILDYVDDVVFANGDAEQAVGPSVKGQDVGDAAPTVQAQGEMAGFG